MRPILNHRPRRQRRWPFLLSIFLLAAAALASTAAAPAVAQDDPPAVSPEADAATSATAEDATRISLVPRPVGTIDPGAVLTIEDGTLELPLDVAIELALARNLGLVIERYNWIQSREGVLQNLGIYDTTLTGSLTATESTQPTVEVVEGVPVTQNESQSLSLGLRQLVPTGGVLDASLFANRRKTNSQNVFLNPLFSANQSVSFTQPLLRGFGRLPTERGIMIARASAAQSSELFEQQVAETIDDVERAYWDLVEARDQLGVTQEALRLAQVLHEQNRVRVDVGTLAPLELVQSEAGIANREGEIIRAEATIGDAEDRLRALLNLEQDEYWDLPIVPTTEPRIEFIEVDRERAIGIALAERPEVATELLRLDILEINREFFRQQVLPRLDLQLSYGLAGLSGTGPAFTNPETGESIGGTSGDLTDAFDQLRDGDFDDWQVQLLFSYPLQNRAARAQRAIADYDLEQGLAELDQLKQRIIIEVRSAARQLETAAKQIESARVSRVLEERNLDAERKRYENGMSSSFRVLEIQEDLTQARSREVSAVTAYRRALAEFYRAIGRLVEEKGVELDTGDGYPY